MRLRNKSLTRTAYIYCLGSLIIPENDIVNVPPQFSERQVREAILAFPDLVLLDGYILNQDDIFDGSILGNNGVMVKDIYDKDYNHIVDESENSGSGGSGSIEVAFTHLDFSLGSLSIGILKGNINIEEIKLIVDSPFNLGNVSVGDAGDGSRLMSSSSSDITSAYTYIVESEYVYSADTMVNIYFQGSPTQGSGRVIIFSS